MMPHIIPFPPQHYRHLRDADPNHWTMNMSPFTAQGGFANLKKLRSLRLVDYPGLLRGGTMCSLHHPYKRMAKG